MVQEMVHCYQQQKNYGCCCLVYKIMMMRQRMMHNQVATNILQTPAVMASKTCSPGCLQGAIILFGVQNPHLRSKSLNIYLKQGCVAETRHQFLFSKTYVDCLHCNCLESECGAGSSLPVMSIEYLEYLTFQWVRATSKPLYIFLQSSLNPY